jgi:hypothetical protein
MNQEVRLFLIELARKKKTITYQELSDACNLKLVMRESEYARAEIGRILGDISTFEFNNKRPLISSLVISKGDSYQGDGFYKLAEALGFGSWKKLKNDISFEVGQMNACFDFWRDELNYSKWK